MLMEEKEVWSLSLYWLRRGFSWGLGWVINTPRAGRPTNSTVSWHQTTKLINQQHIRNNLGKVLFTKKCQVVSHFLLACVTIATRQSHWMTIPKFWPKPIPKLFFQYQIFRNRYRDFFFRYQIFRNQNFFSETKFSETNTETPQKLAKVSRPKPRLLNILEKSSPNIFLLFLLWFSFPPEKRYSPFPNIFLLFLLLRNRTSMSTLQSLLSSI